MSWVPQYLGSLGRPSVECAGAQLREVYQAFEVEGT